MVKCVDALDKLATDSKVLGAMPGANIAVAKDFDAWLRGYRKALDSIRSFLEDELRKGY
jgi:hypothetical protein